MPAEDVLSELQKQKQERLAKSGTLSEISTTDLPSAPPSVAPSSGDLDGRSLTSIGESESFVHASQAALTDGGETAAPSVPRRTKVQMWNDLKIQSIARAFTLIYTLALLTLFTRIQLNLLGRRNYLASVVSMASPPPASPDEGNGNQILLENHDDDNFDNAYGNDYETNRKYLSFSWWLLHRGCRDMMQKVLAAVQEVFGPLNPRDDISLEKLSELTVEVRKRIEGATDAERRYVMPTLSSHADADVSRTAKYLPFLLPPSDQEAFVLSSVSSQSVDSPPSTPLGPASPDLSIPPSLRRLLDETSDLVDSPSFHHVLTLLLDSGFSLLVDNKIAQLAYKIVLPSQSSARVVEVVDPKTTKTKVANTLAIFCRQAHVIGSGGQAASGVGLGGAPVPGTGGNEYLDAMERVGDLEAFAAVVYSSNFEFEAPDAALPAYGEARPTTAESLPSDSIVIVDREVTGMPVVADLETPGAQSGFDAAWEKALAKEDGTS